MSRVLEVRDSRTVVIDLRGVPTVVELRGVRVPAEDETSATRYLRRILGTGWVYVEKGDLYRSPDAFHVNDAMRRRAWLGGTYLGELDLRLPDRRPSLAGAAPPPQKKKKSRPPREKD